MRQLAYTRLRLLLLLVSLCFSGNVSQVWANPSPKPVKIGLITPLTGPRASIGEDARQGVELALDTLGQSAEPALGRLQLIIEDSQGDPAKGVAAYKKLVLDGVRFVLTQNSNVSLAVAPLVDRDGVIQLAITTTSEKYSTPNDNTFRTNGPTKPEAQLMARTLKDRGIKPGQVGIITMQDEYPVTLERFLLEELASSGYSAITESFLPQESDFRSIISRLISRKVSSIIFLGYQTQAGMFVKQFRELGSPVPLVLTNTPVNNREFFEAAGSSATGVLLTYPLPNLSNPAAAAFRKRYGKDPNFFSANAYDGLLIADRALSGCNYIFDIACLKQALFSLKNFQGLSGTKGFDDKFGDMQDSYFLMIARDGKFIPVEAKS